MTAYYCELDQDFADKDGTDATTNRLLGPGGLMAAIRGNGSFKAGGLVAGDILYLQDTANLQRLVTFDCNGTDVSAWEVGDVVKDNNTGNEWQGKVVQERDNVATGLSDDDILLVQLDSAYDIGDVVVGSGINNTTKTETSALTSASVLGIWVDGNAGTADGGHIRFIGTTDLTDPTNNLGQAVFDGQIDVGATAATWGWHIPSTAPSVPKHLSYEYLTIQNTSAEGYDSFDKTGVTALRFYHVLIQDTGSYGFGCYRGDKNLYVRCIAKSCPAAGIYPSGSSPIVFCCARDNSGDGIFPGYVNPCIISCLSEGNSGDNIKLYRGDAGGIIYGNVIDGSTGASGIKQNETVNPYDSNLFIACNRITNNADYGIDGSLKFKNVLEDWNVFYGNTTGDLNNQVSGSNSYGDGANHISDPADDGLDANFMVESGKELRSTALQLDWA